MAWGIFPILLATKGFTIGEIGIVTAIYPAVWGIGQLFTGKMADKFCKKDMLYTGMFLQAIALIVLVWANTHVSFCNAVFHLRLGYCNGVSNIPGNSCRKYKSAGPGKKHWYFPFVERPGLCHWCNTHRNNSRPDKHQCSNSFHWFAHICICTDHPVQNEMQNWWLHLKYGIG